jgi:hypothetical protein
LQKYMICTIPEIPIERHFIYHFLGIMIICLPVAYRMGMIQTTRCVATCLVTTHRVLLSRLKPRYIPAYRGINAIGSLGTPQPCVFPPDTRT